MEKVNLILVTIILFCLNLSAQQERSLLNASSNKVQVNWSIGDVVRYSYELSSIVDNKKSEGKIKYIFEFKILDKTEYGYLIRMAIDSTQFKSKLIQSKFDQFKKLIHSDKYGNMINIYKFEKKIKTKLKKQLKKEVNYNYLRNKLYRPKLNAENYEDTRLISPFFRFYNYEFSLNKNKAKDDDAILFPASPHPIRAESVYKITNNLEEDTQQLFCLKVGKMESMLNSMVNENLVPRMIKKYKIVYDAKTGWIKNCEEFNLIETEEFTEDGDLRPLKKRSLKIMTKWKRID